MYPSRIVDESSLHLCLDRMYKDYVNHCKKLGGGDFVFSKEEWLDMLKNLDRVTLARVISSFNEYELSVMSN